MAWDCQHQESVGLRSDRLLRQNRLLDYSEKETWKYELNLALVANRRPTGRIPSSLMPNPQAVLI